MKKNPLPVTIEPVAYAAQIMGPESAARLPRFIGCSTNDAAAKFRTQQIAVVGTGSVGGRVSFHLARLGVRSLLLVDGKSFKPESLLTHEIQPEDVLRPKAIVFGQRCKAISPLTNVRAFTSRVERLPINALADVDAVVVATDNLAAELEVSRRCRQLGKPMIHAAVHGETLSAQVSCLSNTSEEDPCVACRFNPDEWRQLERQARFPCDGSEDPGTEASGPPTMSVSNLCSLAADLALNQLQRLVLGLGASVANTLLEFCGYTNLTVTSPLTRNITCPSDHRRCAIAVAPEPLQDTSFAALADAVGFSRTTSVVTFMPEGFEWARLGECRCPTPRPVNRFVPAAQSHAGRCPECQAPILVSPFFRDRAVSAWTLGKAMHDPLAVLGVDAVDCLVADNGRRAVLFRNPELSSRLIQ